MTEKQVEQALRRAVRQRGGLALKFVSPGLSGVPDRIVLMPGRRCAFVELKAPGRQMRPLQLRRKRQLEAQGFRVYVIDHPDQIGGVLDELCAP
ncbi:VRR-NUC domain-containing protein [Bacillota bacterium Meth-B3]